ncbi:hypothetical protein APHMUC_0991 [Anaplasma phagocytophilum str. ApMUC09]|uniref:Lipoprotein n=1 Tax=Anaplasma phagocytophilum str. ApMUC09 TaxID=1359152 RepID=A0A0F3NAX3_ANAPH|nr:hypothetical protein APHMUC_0991 [Anaplasma phagocytophilum str. ApMUC09]SCV63612.1 hypothetical protein ANAPH2_00688 [Anaplasma phagocytophilum]
MTVIKITAVSSTFVIGCTLGVMVVLRDVWNYTLRKLEIESQSEDVISILHCGNIFKCAVASEQDSDF